MKQHLLFPPGRWRVLPLLILLLGCLPSVRAMAPVKVADSPLPAPCQSPTVFSDRDEDPASATTARIETVADPTAAFGVTQIQRLVFDIQKNATLGYEYAGIAFPFESPQPVSATGTVQFFVRSSEPLSVQINARDSARTNAFGTPTKLEPGKWQVVKQAMPTMNTIDPTAIESFSLSITSPGRGTLDVALAQFPLMTAASPGSPSQTERASSGTSYDLSFTESPEEFEKPIPISDRDEDSDSATEIDVSYALSELPDGKSGSAMQIRFHVVGNKKLGYEYAGVAFPFNTPAQLAKDASFTFVARASVPIDELEIVLRDADKKRSTVRIRLPASNSWETVSLPASRFAGIDTEHIESAAIVVISNTKGYLQIAQLTLPITIQTSATSKPAEEPRWFTSLAMARNIASDAGKPLLVYLDDDPAPDNDLQRDVVWRDLFARVVTARINTASSEGRDVSSISGAKRLPMIIVYTSDGKELTRCAHFESEEAARLLRLLNQ